MTFYNEHDRYPAAWLRNLIAAGHIAPGHVDERSIRDLEPTDVDRFTQAHFFAGIGVWSYALRLAGWADSRAVWTGSCPCQPFSAAGKRTGTSDDRHLWPAWFRLIRERRPPIIFGEQVGGAAGLQWLDLVHADLESAPSRRPIFALRASALPTSGNDCSSWPSPTSARTGDYTRDGRTGKARLSMQGLVRGGWPTPCSEPANGEPEAFLERKRRAVARGSSMGVSLTDLGMVAKLAGWPTPDCPNGGRTMPEATVIARRNPQGRKVQVGLENVAMLSAWPTPTAADSDRGSDTYANREGNPTLTGAARLASWRSPNARDWKGQSAQSWLDRETGDPTPTLPDQVLLAGSGPTPTGSPAATAKPGQLNPAHSRWAHGAAQRVGRLRAYGNAIVAPLAAEFVRAAMELLSPPRPEGT